MRNRGKIADGERKDSHTSQKHFPIQAHRPENGQQQPQQQREARGFRCHADVSRDRRRRAFVHIRSPLVKRHSSNFEKQARYDRDQRQDHQHVAVPPRFDGHLDHFQIRPRRQRPAKRAEVRRGAQSVENRKSVRQNGGAERSQQQIFHRAFVRAAIAPQKSRQHVETDGHRLEAQKLNDQVVARGHEHHAHGGEQDQRVILTVIFIFNLQVAHRKNNYQRGGNQKNESEKQEKRIDQKRVAESNRLPARRSGSQLPKTNRAEDDAKHGHQRVEILVPRFEQVIGQQDAHGEENKHHLRQK